MTTTELNLDNIKIGDEIVTIIPKNGKLEYGSVRIVTEWDDRFKRWRLAMPHNLQKNCDAFPANGHGKYFMSKNPDADFYYSANPMHIKAARAAHKKAKVKAEKEAAEQARRFALTLPIGELLGSEYYDSEECYTFDTTNEITEMLMVRLTDDQITTLKGWLGVKN